MKPTPKRLPREISSKRHYSLGWAAGVECISKGHEHLHKEAYRRGRTDGEYAARLATRLDVREAWDEGHLAGYSEAVRDGMKEGGK